MAGGLALAFGLASCGGGTSATGGQGGGGNNAILTAYHATVAAKSAKVSMHEELAGAPGGSGSQGHISGQGLISFQRKAGSLNLSIPSAGTTQLRILFPDLYLHLPRRARGRVPGHKPWLEINLDKVAQAEYGASFSELTFQDPTQRLSYLEGVSAKGIKRAGTATIRGVATTHYKVTVSLAKMAAQRGPKAQKAVKKLEAKLHTSTIPAEVWVDHKGRVRQLRYEFPLPVRTATSSSAKGKRPSIRATTDYYDFGVPVKVTAPPKSNVYNETAQATKAAHGSTPPTT